MNELGITWFDRKQSISCLRKEGRGSVCWPLVTLYETKEGWDLLAECFYYKPNLVKVTKYSYYKWHAKSGSHNFTAWVILGDLG